jgi:hypothetical protein
VFVFHVVTDTAGRPEVRKSEKSRKSETNSGTGRSVKQTAQRSQQDNGGIVGTDRNGLENLQREIWCKTEWKDVSNQKSRQVERSPGQVFWWLEAVDLDYFGASSFMYFGAPDWPISAGNLT